MRVGGVACELSEYAEGVAECEILHAPVTCSGSAVPCEDDARCDAKGCAEGEGCTGGEHECQDWDVGAPGCLCSGDCTGTFFCADRLSQIDCQDAGIGQAFDWSYSACLGTPTPCEELDGYDVDPEFGFDATDYLDATCLRVCTYIWEQGEEALCFPWKDRFHIEPYFAHYNVYKFLERHLEYIGIDEFLRRIPDLEPGANGSSPARRTGWFVSGTWPAGRKSPRSMSGQRNWLVSP